MDPIDPHAMDQGATGILPDRAIRALAAAGAIVAPRPFDADQIQPASLDVRLGTEAFRLRASFLPGPHHAVADRLEALKLHQFDLTGGAVLETGCVYLVPLLETLDLPADLTAFANPKSSTGRLDVFVRVIADRTAGFDQVPAGYRGALYLEISPRTFPVLVKTGSRLAQIRFRRGRAAFDAAELRALDAAERLVEGGALDVQETGGVASLSVSVDLAGDFAGSDAGLIGYRAKRHTGVVDVDRRGALAVGAFWEPLRKDALAAGGLILDPGEFYILASKEAVHVPPHCAAEMVPFDPLVGEFRVHYAGFFDPGFGHAAAGGHGARAVLEVRSREVPFVLEHGQTVGRLVYERMAGRPSALYGEAGLSNYQGQGLKLSKHFRP